jgi:hypothetical protein
MAETTLVAGGKRSAEDFIVGGCGFVTCVVTALILWLVEQRFGFSLYSWMFWFVIPVGALLSGFAGASGYYLGAWFFGRRPTRLLLLNILISSVLTFFLIYYLSYVTLQVEGKDVSQYISFWQFLDIAIRSTAMEFRYHAVNIGSTGALGSFGYVIGALQVLGFAAGGFCVYSYLLTKPYCDKCSKYLSAKGKQIRYVVNPEGLQEATVHVLTLMENGEILSAVEEHRNKPGFGSSAPSKDCRLRSVIEVQRCKKCEMHWVRFALESLSRDAWEEVSGTRMAKFTEQAVSV